LEFPLTCQCIGITNTVVFIKENISNVVVAFVNKTDTNISKLIQNANGI